MLPSAHSSASSSRCSSATHTTIFERQMAIMLQRGENNRVDDYREFLPHFWPCTMVKHDDGHHQSVYPAMHHQTPAYLMHLETGDEVSVGKTAHVMPKYNTGCNNSSSAMLRRPDLQCNSISVKLDQDMLCIPCPNKKRKAELDLEEKGNDKDKSMKEARETEESREGQSEITTKTDRENSTNTCSKVSEAQKPDYIHVRARRGQATDSHSLAERARREKISKKMKCLQDLVPGCERVTGKAGMLDEIINYVQSLQKQVEFLSMKLATLNPEQEFTLSTTLAPEIPGHMTGLLVAPPTKLVEAKNSPCFPYNQMQVLETTTNCGMGCTTMNQSQGTSHQKAGIITPSFIDPSTMHQQLQQLQQLSSWDFDWPNNNPYNSTFISW